MLGLFGAGKAISRLPFVFPFPVPAPITRVTPQVEVAEFIVESKALVPEPRGPAAEPAARLPVYTPAGEKIEGEYAYIASPLPEPYRHGMEPLKEYVREHGFEGLIFA